MSTWSGLTFVLLRKILRFTLEGLNFSIVRDSLARIIFIEQTAEKNDRNIK